MRKDKQSKIVAILALCVSVVGLTLGFAAFSNTLTISSSATVSPNSSDFKLTIYGIGQEINNNYPDTSNISIFNSTEVSYPYFKNGITATKATIDNDTLTISDLAVNFIDPGKETTYFFKISNESQYDAYLKLEDYENNFKPTCTPGNGTTASLVQLACEDIGQTIYLYTPDGEQIEEMEDVLLAGSYKIEKNSYILMEILIDYASDANNRADGPFTAVWDDIVLDFSTAA